MNDNAHDSCRDAADFSIILINFNSAAYIAPCLDRLRNQTFGGVTEIIVVNHRATDGSMDILRDQADITLIEPGRNLGFSGGNNLGISRSRGKYVLCLNFDCLLAAEFLQEVWDAFEANPSVGMISGKLRKLVDMQATMYLDSTGIDFTTLVPADRGEWQYDDGQFDNQTSIFGPSGAAGCYRREALESVVYRKSQYFDEQMFTYCEDIDLAWRLNLAGWRGLFVPAALAQHERGATRKGSLWKKVGYYAIGFRNRYFTILKNLRREDVKGRRRKLRRQEWRFLSSWCRKSPLRWAVGGYVMLRLAGLMLRPSFLAKRRLVRRRWNGSHLDLTLDTDFWDASYQRRIKKPSLVSVAGSTGTETTVSRREWLVSAEGYQDVSWGEEELFEGTFVDAKTFIEIHLPEEHQDDMNRLQFSVDLDAPSDLCADIQAFAIDGSKAQSDWRILSGGKGRFTFDLGKMELAPGAENISVWQGQWGMMRLNLAGGAGSKITIRRMFCTRDAKVISNTQLNLLECRDLPLVLESKPALIYAEVCTHCNMRCSMCGRTVHGVGKSDQGYMKREVFEKLTEIFTPGSSLAMFGRGETLLHPDFPYFLKLAKEKGMKVTFNSNGKALSEDIARAMAEYGQDSLTISCSAGAPETYEAIHCGGKWDQLWSNIAGLKKAKEQYGTGPDGKPSIYLEFVSQGDNIEELPALVRRAIEWGLTGVIVIDLVAHSDELEQQQMNTDLTLPIAERCYEEAVGIVESLRHVSPHFELRLPAAYNSLTKKFTGGQAAEDIRELDEELSSKSGSDTCGLCLEPWQTFYARFDSQVTPCVITNRILGDLEEQDALAIWNGPEFQKFRARMRGENKPFECLRCHLFPGPHRYDKALNDAEQYEPL